LVAVTWNLRTRGKRERRRIGFLPAFCKTGGLIRILHFYVQGNGKKKNSERDREKSEPSGYLVKRANTIRSTLKSKGRWGRGDKMQGEEYYVGGAVTGGHRLKANGGKGGNRHWAPDGFLTEGVQKKAET